MEANLEKIKNDFENTLEERLVRPFSFVDTTATQKVFSLNKRIRAVTGGTSASKTISILVWLIDYCQTRQFRQKLCSVVSESHPHLEKGAILDFQNIMKDRGYWDEDRWNETKHVYIFETGHKLEFYSVDTYGKAHGPRRDVLFVNEANNLEWKIVDQLVTRTREIVWLDWNPSEEFWFYTEILGKREDVDFITLTYLDNEALDQITISEIESHKGNKAWWIVYGLGQLGEIEARIYRGWKIINEIPEGAKLVRRWVDFGYSQDPASIGDLYSYDGGFILDQIAYATRMSNAQIGEVIKSQDEQVLVIADSSEPKSIAEIAQMGITIIPAVKGPDSRRFGIKVVQNQKISITSGSIETIKEFRNYCWIVDKDGKILNEPEDGNDHSMDGVRYAITSVIGIKSRNKKVYEQKAYESTLPYSNPMEEEKVEDTRPMRKPESWGPVSKFHQRDYDSSFPVDSI